MKSNLILKTFKTEKVKGTMNIKDLRTFFGGKIAYTEDNIVINDDAIEYSYVDSGKELGYQYYDKETIPEQWESEFVENLTDLKDNNHSISILNQTDVNLTTNTRWKMTINARRILKDYLFFKFKEYRTFQGINYDSLFNRSINKSIYDYIEMNIINSYKFSSIDFYVLYSDIKTQQTTNSNILLQYQPIFTEDVYDLTNKVSNFNIINLDEFNYETLTLNYYQTKPSHTYKFDYYFDLNFVKI